MNILLNVFVFSGWTMLAIAFIWSLNQLYKLEKNNYV